MQPPYLLVADFSLGIGRLYGHLSKAVQRFTHGHAKNTYQWIISTRSSSTAGLESASFPYVMIGEFLC